MDAEKALETLKKVQALLTEAGMVAAPPRAAKEKSTKPKKEPRPADPVALLTRVQGIIKNFNEDNAEGKLQNLIALVSALRGRI
ncbi:MAG: hypothetical protein ABSE76_00490 [Minisyncoccia bacterium]|jgi:hypothetical protein